MKTVELDELQPHLEAVQNYGSVARDALKGRLQARSIKEVQRAAHVFAWIATSVAALEATLSWARAGGGPNWLPGPWVSK